MNTSIVNRNWNERYLTDDTPWTIHELSLASIHLIETLLPKANTSILEIGCGYGQEAIALAKIGYQVTAVDIAEAAISQAKKNAATANVHIHFQAIDLMHDQHSFMPFDLALDIAVLHTMENEITRLKFSQTVAKLLKPKAFWVNLSLLSPNALKVAEANAVKAPPALSKEELQHTCGDYFSYLSQHPTTYRILREGQPVTFPAIISVFQKK